MRTRAFDSQWGQPLHHEVVNEDGLSLPGIYQWDIQNAGRYVGQYKHRRRLRAYARNTHRLLSGLPYHIRDRTFRLVHQALAHAVIDERRIVLTILENPAIELLAEREAALIAERGCLNDPKLWNDQHRCTCGLAAGGTACSEAALSRRLWTPGQKYTSPGE